jgi:hypothetical protein
MATDPILIGGGHTSDWSDFVPDESEDKSSTDFDCEMMDEGSFRTPPPLQRFHLPRPALCRFNVADFISGAPKPNPYLRQFVGEYLPWLHNYGEETCPFTEPSAALQQFLLEIGMPLADSELSPGDHVRVDKHAFTREVHVKVHLELLGYDPGMWGGLTEFRDLIIDRYYQSITGCPMFSIDFGGSIGQQEIKVCNTKPDSGREGMFFGCF